MSIIFVTIDSCPEVWHWERRTNAYMALHLKIHISTIFCELERGKTGELIHRYRADLAEQKKRSLGGNRGRPKKTDDELAGIIRDRLRQAWSPEQISGRLRHEGMAMSW
jgi:IS30 family transposase